MTGRDEAHGICASLEKGASSRSGLAGAVTVSDAPGERVEIKRKAAEAQDTRRAGGPRPLGDSLCAGEGAFPGPVSSIPTELRAAPVPADTSVSRHTSLETSWPHLGR